MELVELRFENYKAFHRPATLELRPLTLLIGRNSAGKSAVARLPLLLSRALSGPAKSPVELEVDSVDFGASFLDLIHNRTPHGAIGLGATFEDGARSRIEVWTKIQHVSEYMMQLVSAFELRMTGAPPLKLTWIGTNPLEDPAPYRLQVDDATREVKVAFRGLLPHPEIFGHLARMTQAAMVFSECTFLVSTVLARVGYLGPFREAPQRLYRFPGGNPESVGRRGSDAPALLAADYLRRRGDVLQRVSDWYQQRLGGWPLSIARQGDSFSIVLRNPMNPAVEVNLADVGTGLSQVLPLVVQRQFEVVTGKTGGIEIVEQPELHLHPGAHGDLADLYIEAAKQQGARFVIETHSENFVLRVRRRIAEKTLDPDRVSLYWVDDAPQGGSELKRIEILPTGDVSDWPRGVFSEDFEEAKAIRAAQRAHA
ncbi:AAA family ATPase [Sorangium sp. So ce124]|uniref:AAA family ATPase n=1 Tax=Sorangium sp. So ce124 TaxID=3133280 RepID=UPI003F5D9A34